MTEQALAWFEIPVSDMERAIEFYSKIYDTQLTEAEVPMPRVRIAVLPNSIMSEGAAGTKPGGSLITTDYHKPTGAGGVTVYLNANPDLNLILQRAEAAGGKIICAKSPLPGSGYFGWFIDSEGNYMGVMSKE